MDQKQHKRDVLPFASGRLSNWFQCTFVDGEVAYSSSEQYFIHQKAILFGDNNAAAAIMQTSDCKQIKQIGRLVKGFDEKKWAEHREQIMEAGIFLKFSQNIKLAQFLVKTKDKLIVEASPWDTIWGVGIKPSDPRIQDPDKWLGQNLLGKAIMRVRTRLQM